MKKCLIIDRMHESIEEMLLNAGIAPTYLPNITRADVLEILPKYAGIIVRSKLTVDKEILDRGINLEFIARAGAGLDQIDVEEVEKRGIALFNAPEGNQDALAEHAMAILLALLNKVVSADKEVRAGIWDREGNRGYELKGKTVGVIGYGYMGMAFSRRLSAFGCEVLAYDKYKKQYSDAYVKESTMEEIYDNADIISLHIPLTTETKLMFNETCFQKFRKSIWFVNTARGEIVDTNDLLSLLDKGKLLGAALDVLENEKLSHHTTHDLAWFNRLKLHNNVILTPHVGGWSYESYFKINQVLVAKIYDYYNNIR